MGIQNSMRTLLDIANQLDQQGMAREADAVTGVMQRIAQQERARTDNTLRTLQQGGQGVMQTFTGLGQAALGAGKAIVNFSPLGLGISAAQDVAGLASNAMADLTEEGKQAVINWLRSEGIELRTATPQQIEEAKIRSGVKQAIQSAAKMLENEPMKQRYLGWGFDAARRQGIAAGRAALIQHMRAKKHTQPFMDMVMREYDNTVAKQQTFAK